MKAFLLLLLIVPCSLVAQVFPFAEGFTGIPSNTLPAGWSGDMKVRAYHGLNDDKGLAADIGNADQTDSVITPWIGPLDNNSEFYFWYRMVDDFIFPSTEKHITTDSFTISISTDSINFTDLFTIDSSNHLSTLSFKRITFPITAYGGQVVKFKLRCKYGAGSSYFVDIDSVRVRVRVNTDIKEADNSSVKVYPTIADSYIRIEATSREEYFTQMEIVNLCGQTMLATAFDTQALLDVSQYPVGVYLVKLSSPEFILSRKIIIQR